MPNRAQRRGNDPSIDKWLHVEDDNGDPYDIFLRDISAKDEADYITMTQGQFGGLCDLFLKGEMTLVGISGLIWSQRRKYEKKLTVADVMKTVSMATIETLEMHDPEDEGDVVSELPSDDPQRKLAEMRATANRQLDEHDPSEGLPGFDGPTGGSGPGSGPPTD